MMLCLVLSLGGCTGDPTAQRLLAEQEYLDLWARYGQSLTYKGGEAARKAKFLRTQVDAARDEATELGEAGLSTTLAGASAVFAESPRAIYSHALNARAYLRFHGSDCETGPLIEDLTRAVGGWPKQATRPRFADVLQRYNAARVGGKTHAEAVASLAKPAK
jgi:hypothetical protein